MKTLLQSPGDTPFSGRRAKPLVSGGRTRCGVACALLALPGIGHADTADAHPYKLTVGEYHADRGSDGQDVNLRWTHDGTHAWVADYHDRDFGNQLRTGADTSIDLGGGIASLTPSIQAATRGFVGGSANLQVGQRWYGLVGWGRTNLRPYVNLNFDPNDAITVGVGWQGSGERSLALTLISDDRLHTGQRDLHLAARWPLVANVRATLDLLYKTGLADDGRLVRGNGFSATLDWPTWFARIAYDPKQNFSVQNVTRLSAGVRF